MKVKVLLTASMLLLSACGANKAIKSTNSIPDKLDRMDERLVKTECTLKKGISFEALLKEEYGRDLLPAPFDLMPFARFFAQCADEEELTEVVYLWMKKMNEVTFDVPNPTPAQIEDFNHRKLHIYSALSAVAGFIPQEKVERIVESQIRETARYQDSALELLMLRTQFIRDVLIGNGLFTKGLIDVGKVEKAVEYANQLEYIARLPFAKDIGLSATGFIPPYDDVKESLNPSVALSMWKDIKVKAERLALDMKTWTGKPNEDTRLYAKRQERFNRAISTINQRINSWTNLP